MVTLLWAPFAQIHAAALAIRRIIFRHTPTSQFSSWKRVGIEQPSGGAIQATLVSSASVPLPQDHPPTENVLATEDSQRRAPELEQQKSGADTLA